MFPIFPVEFDPPLYALNGKMDPDTLTFIESGVWLANEVAGQWLDLVSYLKEFRGWDLRAYEGYRNYSNQLRIFLERYTEDITQAAKNEEGSWSDIKRWDGHVFYLRVGYSPASVPGTSNHGWGLALDANSSTLTPSQLFDLREAAPIFGWCWEIQREPWHLRAYRLMPASNPYPNPEEPPVAAMHVIKSDQPGEAEFVRFDNGAAIHYGGGEAPAFAALPVYVEPDRQAYWRLVKLSETRWRPADWPLWMNG